MIEQYYTQRTKSESLGNAHQATWTYVVTPSKAELSMLHDAFSISQKYLNDALDMYEIPRFEKDENFTYIFSRFAIKEGNQIQTVPILFVLSDSSLITVSAHPLPNIEQVLEYTDHAQDHILLFMRLLKAIDEQYDIFINEGTRRIRKLNGRLGKRDVGPTDFIQFVHIENDMNNFLSALGPTNATLRHILNDITIDKLSNHRDLVSTVILNNEQSIQTCNSNLTTLASIRRAFELINQHHLDRTIKILTLFSVFISIPTMFFSMYGMNVGLPWQKGPHTFLGLVIVCVLTVVAAYAVGRKKRIF